eukprot:3717346-Pyramimonas_sp.AAC.1
MQAHLADPHRGLSSGTASEALSSEASPCGPCPGNPPGDSSSEASGAAPRGVGVSPSSFEPGPPGASL